MIRKVVLAGAVALGMSTAFAGVASAEEVQVEGNYATAAACNADGPHVQVDRDNNKWTHFDCRQGNDGLWYLYLSN